MQSPEHCTSAMNAASPPIISNSVPMTANHTYQQDSYSWLITLFPVPAATRVCRRGCTESTLQPRQCMTSLFHTSIPFSTPAATLVCRSACTGSTPAHAGQAAAQQWAPQQARGEAAALRGRRRSAAAAAAGLRRVAALTALLGSRIPV
jgi:hypothetical protein